MCSSAWPKGPVKGGYVGRAERGRGSEKCPLKPPQTDSPPCQTGMEETDGAGRQRRRNQSPQGRAQGPQRTAGSPLSAPDPAQATHALTVGKGLSGGNLPAGRAAPWSQERPLGGVTLPLGVKATPAPQRGCPRIDGRVRKSVSPGSRSPLSTATASLGTRKERERRRLSLGCRCGRHPTRSRAGTGRPGQPLCSSAPASQASLYPCAGRAPVGADAGG